ncbi:biotin-dependent carboxyltransferase family protein [Telmatospirillum siberiense]|uniref:Allophanate hydrolase n=1 Tax=Telmatospirillum siberiense TaxID=382514 RepID=A0A2N3PR29_9PROT|nr:biotin-dependent carboxyltransferase family protein [Telmatospirillum siberiense]PKU22859.1 allophanate hydrolase [Telmatospirillum siberiense]
MTVNVLQPGLSTTVQDLGRPGFYHVGIPLSGGMDRYALIAANLLVGNDDGDAVLETTFLGPELQFLEDALVAVTGADLPPLVDGVEQPVWEAFSIKAGQVLSFDYLRSGARSYIAIAGGIDVPLALGSRSTYALGGLGGYQGRALKAGDMLSVGPAKRPAGPGRGIGPELHPPLPTVTELRMLPGLYWHRMTDEAAANFFEDVWKLAPEADRIGGRFRGGRSPKLVDRPQPFGAGSNPSNITDACYPYGSIQIPGCLEPIVLHRDAVSVGGYFMVGTVISADMDLIGQLPPNAKTRFVKVDMEQALEARRAYRRRLDRLRASLS